MPDSNSPESSVAGSRLADLHSVRQSTTVALVAMMMGTALLITHCAGEEELERNELARMQRLIPRGSPYSVARARLEHLGFTCLNGNGAFQGNGKKSYTAANFLNCGKDEWSWLRLAHKGVSVIVVPEGNKAGELHVGVGFTHL